MGGATEPEATAEAIRGGGGGGRGARGGGKGNGCTGAPPCLCKGGG